MGFVEGSSHHREVISRDGMPVRVKEKTQQWYDGPARSKQIPEQGTVPGTTNPGKVPPGTVTPPPKTPSLSDSRGVSGERFGAKPVNSVDGLLLPPVASAWKPGDTDDEIPQAVIIGVEGVPEKNGSDRSKLPAGGDFPTNLPPWNGPLDTPKVPTLPRVPTITPPPKIGEKGFEITT